MRVIEVLGPGCPRCEKTTAEIRAAVDRPGMDVAVRHVTDPFAITSRGVLFAVPAVVVDGLLVRLCHERSRPGCRGDRSPGLRLMTAGRPRSARGVGNGRLTGEEIR